MSAVDRPYVGRFAPSPTGLLHAGSLVAAVASYLDARAHQGRWLVRIEDVDWPRTVQGADVAIIDTLARLGMRSDGEVLYQSRRSAHYAAALERLRREDQVYPCACTRRELADSQSLVTPHEGPRLSSGRELIYPGTCRSGLPPGRNARSWRVRVDATPIVWADRNGSQHVEVLEQAIGDFILHRADGVWAYQLAVVIDDAAQGVSDVVRGDDLSGSTARQIHLQRLLGLPSPRYLHVPVVLADDGQKLSKQSGAQPLGTATPLETLNAALRHLGLEPVYVASLSAFWSLATERWQRSRWMGQP